MKGPGGRLRFDIRRVWECSVCHRRDLTNGDVVNMLCTCSARTDPPRQNWMKLIETKPARPVPPPPPSPPAEQVSAPPEAAQPSPPEATSPSPTNADSTPHGS